MEMNIQNTKIEQKRNETKDSTSELSDLEKKSIELGLSDANNGKLKPNSEAEKIYGKWL